MVFMTLNGRPIIDIFDLALFSHNVSKVSAQTVIYEPFAQPIKQ